MIRWIFALHPLASIGVMVAACVAAIVAVTYIYNSIEAKGYDRAIAEVAAKNKGAIANVRKATKTVSDCYSIGGDWRADLGLCE